MIPNQRKWNKGTRSTWNKEGFRSKFKARMVGKKISETTRQI